MAYFVYKKDAFRGRFFSPWAALQHIYAGDKTLTVAHAFAEGWEITTSPRQ